MCQSCEWSEALEELNKLCDDEDYDFASDTLFGIAEWVEKSHHITEKQITAIANIKRAVENR